MIGRTISHYEILEKLGEGGMGVVYRAHDTKLDRDVAIKFLPTHLSTDPEAEKRFIHEAQAASSIEHANICTIHEIDETNEGETFIVMPRYEGELLSDYNEKGRMPLEDSLSIVERIAGALAEAHDHGIVHRDVKPANIIIDPNGRPILLDFGLAKLSERTKLTRDGTTVGTVAYMAPEQAAGREVDSRTDMFSLGVILYEMVTGVRPFEGDHDAAVLYSIAHESPAQIVSTCRQVQEHARDENCDHAAEQETQCELFHCENCWYREANRLALGRSSGRFADNCSSAGPLEPAAWRQGRRGS